jgi:hypothetical protein
LRVNVVVTVVCRTLADLGVEEQNKASEEQRSTRASQPSTVATTLHGETPAVRAETSLLPLTLNKPSARTLLRFITRAQKTVHFVPTTMAGIKALLGLKAADMADETEAKSEHEVANDEVGREWRRLDSFRSRIRCRTWLSRGLQIKAFPVPTTTIESSAVGEYP